MCTVSLFPLKNEDFILTSNRDESPNRIPLAPEFYEINDIKTLFPKDKNAGGTWIGASEKNRVLCILNGGFKFHERQDAYRSSRGLIVKELLVSTDFVSTIDNMDFGGIEPFTLIIVDWNANLNFFELVWDGQKKHFTELDNKPQIWSSSSLYSEEMKLERREWFTTFLNTSNVSKDAILEFHKTAGKGNDDFGVIMNRGFVKTTSITQIVKDKNFVEMSFLDLQNNTTSKAILKTLTAINE